jgi:FkbM family methyltransferase
MKTITRIHNNIEFTFLQTPGVEGIFDEIFKDNYKVFQNNIIFGPNDIIIDIGANIGSFSILLAKIFPFIKVFAIEPIPLTYLTLCENIKLNYLQSTIIPICVALSDSSKIIELEYSQKQSGGASSYISQPSGNTRVLVPAISFDNLLETLNIQKCKLLKIDCEGAEYDILFNSKYLNRIEYLVGEFHENSLLRQRGFSTGGLAHYCSQHVGKMLYFEWCNMAE